jgi:hypothetical protein
MTTPTNFQADAHPAFSKHDSERFYGRIFIGWILALLAFDLFTIRQFPVPWNDEVMFADPAASLLLHGHWASTAWYGRGDLTYWTGNVPAYSFLLVPWLWLWGISAPAVRSLNCVLIAITMVCTWFSVKRLNLVPSPKIRLAALAALSMCYPVAYCVRCGRPDVLGMLIFAVSSLFWTCPRKTIACLGLFGCAVLIPFVGLQYAFYMPVLLGVLFWASGKPALTRLYAVIGGGILGAILLWAYHQFFAGWDGLLANMADVHGRRPTGLWANFRSLMEGQIFLYYLGRPHFILLIVAAALLGVAWKHLERISQRDLLLALVMLLVPGVVVGFGTHFMAPYHWLAVAPTLILLASAASKSWKNLGSKTRLGCGILAVGLAASGRIVFVAMGGVVNDAAYISQIEKTVPTLVQPGEIVYGDWQLYYALKPRAGRIYFLHILPRLTSQEKESVTTAFVESQGQYNAHDATWLANTFGGHWTHAADLPDPLVKITPSISRLLGWCHAWDYIGQPISVYHRDLPLSNAAIQAEVQPLN